MPQNSLVAVGATFPDISFGTFGMLGFLILGGANPVLGVVSYNPLGGVARPCNSPSPLRRESRSGSGLLQLTRGVAY